jgi:hypothetical protein
MHSTPPFERRGGSRRLAALGVALAVLALPLVGAATAANAAADTFSVTSPSEGQTDVPEVFPKTAAIAGEGLTVGNHVDVQYVTGDGTEHTAIYGANTGNDDGSYEVVANFDLLGVGETVVVATVSELTADDEVVASIPLTFTLAVAPNPADPFVVSSPEVGQVVETTTPEFTGTATPGTQIVVLYGARAGSTAEAGTATVGDDGSWSVTTDFSRLEPGSLGTGADVYNYDANGDPIPGVSSPLGVFFTFAEAPVPLIPLTITVDPTTLTASAAAGSGIAVTATGFSPDEQLTLVVTEPDGSELPVADDAPPLFANDEDGSVATTVVVTAAPVGDYTITLTGVRSARTVTTGFAVTADPVTPTTPPTTPATPAPGGGGGSLANTGFELAGGLGLAGMLLLAGGAAAVIVRRRKAKA